MSEVPVTTGQRVAGSDKPELESVMIGFMPLTDCSSVIIAAAKGFDRKYGLRILPSKEASWAAVRDKLVNGELHASHALYGLVYGVHTGIGGPRKSMAVLMGINRNGQAITLSSGLRDQGITDGASLARLIARREREYCFAQTFPTGTHAMWLYYWLAAHGIHPLRDVRSIVIPPPQMVSNMKLGHMDGFCAGEPWHQRALMEDVGFTVATSQQIWPDHPEKVLACTAEFAERYPATARAMTCALLEASRWIDASPANRSEAAELVASRAYVDTDVNVIRSRMLGQYEDGLGRSWSDAHCMRFHDDGEANFPYLSDGMWFLTQFRRWGLLREDIDYLAIARQINRVDIYREAASELGVPLPSDELRRTEFFDGSVWDGAQPAAYAASFAIRA